jgi:hypothetical protein
VAFRFEPALAAYEEASTLFARALDECSGQAQLAPLCAQLRERIASCDARAEQIRTGLAQGGWIRFGLRAGDPRPRTPDRSWFTRLLDYFRSAPHSPPTSPPALSPAGVPPSSGPMAPPTTQPPS